MPVVKPVRSKTLLATLSVLVVVAGMLLGAQVAVADSVQYQSYGRVSQTEACTAQVGETPWQASWGADSSWYPTWEQWANKGTGGWTCGRSITWAKTPVAGGSSSARTYALGDIGPGGGLVFLISGGLRYEMAPKTWSGSSSDDTPLLTWCSNTSSDITGSVGTAVGTGSANTTAMQPAACASGAGVSARAYSGGGLTDWFLPSRDELNAMYTYSLVGGFNSATYGFVRDGYWSSSQFSTTFAYSQDFNSGSQIAGTKANALRVRPVRAF